MPRSQLVLVVGLLSPHATAQLQAATKGCPRPDACVCGDDQHTPGTPYKGIFGWAQCLMSAGETFDKVCTDVPDACPNLDVECCTGTWHPAVGTLPGWCEPDPLGQENLLCADPRPCPYQPGVDGAACYCDETLEYVQCMINSHGEDATKACSAARDACPGLNVTERDGKCHCYSSDPPAPPSPPDDFEFDDTAATAFAVGLVLIALLAAAWRVVACATCLYRCLCCCCSCFPDGDEARTQTDVKARLVQYHRNRLRASGANEADIAASLVKNDKVMTKQAKACALRADGWDKLNGSLRNQ